MFEHLEKLTRLIKSKKTYQVITLVLLYFFIGFIDEMIVGIGAGIEFCPDLSLVLVEDFQALLHLPTVQSGGVGDQDKFDLVENEVGFDLRADAAGAEKIVFGGGLTIAA